MLPKPSAILLAGLNVMVVGATSASAGLLASMLRAVGANSVTSLDDSSVARAMLASRQFDAVVLEGTIKPVNGLEFTRLVRAADEGAIRGIPIVMICGAADRTRVEMARDAGATEFVRRPMSARDLALRIEQAIAAPRAFVVAPSFAGPDRRRRVAPPAVPDRRMAAREQHPATDKP